MSTLGNFNFLANNLLDELGLQPVWEKFRRYFYAVGVGISLFALYITLQIKVQCAPLYPNGTVIRTDLHPWHVNEYCRDSESLTMFRYSGCILLGLNVVILLFASYWLHYSNVSKPLRIFAKIRGLVDEIHLPWEEMKHQMSYPMKASELSTKPADATDLIKKRKQLRAAMTLLPTIEDRSDKQKTEKEKEECCCISIRHPMQTCMCGKNTTPTEANELLLPPESNNDSENSCCSYCDSNIATRYRTRNIVLGITCLSVFFTLLILIGLMISTVGTFNCKYNLTAKRQDYICTMDVGSVAIVCTIVDALAVFCQIVVIGIGFCKVRKVLNAENTKDAKLVKLPALMLINQFYKSSQSSNSEVFGNFIEFFFSKEFEDNVNYSALTGGIKIDSELLKLTGARYTNNTNPILCLPYQFRQCIYQHFGNLVHITNFKLKTYLPLAIRLAEHELWEIFILLLENVEDLGTCSSEDKLEFKKSIKLDFDSLASNYEEIKRISDDFYQHITKAPWHGTHSLLYYATDMNKRKNFQAAIFLLSCFKPLNPYVHYSSETGKNIISEQAMEYIRSPARRCDRFGDYEDLIGVVQECETQLNEERQHKWGCEDMLQRYELVSPDNEILLDMRFERILRRRKLREWSKPASGILQIACRNNHHHIEIALLLAYFPTDSTSPKSPLCYLCGDGPIPSDKCIDEIIKVAPRAWEYDLEDCKDIVKHLANNSRWEMLVGLLNNTKTRCDLLLTESLLIFFKELNINLKKLENGSSRSHGRNILKEALDPHHKFRDPKDRLSVVKFLCLVSKPQLLDAIQQINYSNSLASKIKEKRGAMQHVTTEDFESTKVAVAKFELEYLYDKYNRTGLDEESIKRVADEPLLKWNSQVHNFAVTAAGRGDWKIVISLIHAHITENDARDRSIAINLENVNTIWNRIVQEQPQNSTCNICDLVEQ